LEESERTKVTYCLGIFAGHVAVTLTRSTIDDSEKEKPYVTGDMCMSWACEVHAVKVRSVLKEEE
jgi:hypothetical protein